MTHSVNSNCLKNILRESLTTNLPYGHVVIHGQSLDQIFFIVPGKPVTQHHSEAHRLSGPERHVEVSGAKRQQF